jgi:hypothetical protein
MRRVVLACALLSACAAEDDRPATFTYVYTTIVQPSCTTIGCHNTFTQTYGFRFDTLSGTYAYLTGTVCHPGEPPGTPPGNFVRPGQPDRSKLVHLLRAQDVPRRMPPDRPLPEADIELVEQWILEGAECN